jgi:hypothetical protein
MPLSSDNLHSGEWQRNTERRRVGCCRGPSDDCAETKHTARSSERACERGSSSYNTDKSSGSVDLRCKHVDIVTRPQLPKCVVTPALQQPQSISHNARVRKASGQITHYRDPTYESRYNQRGVGLALAQSSKLGSAPTPKGIGICGCTGVGVSTRNRASASHHIMRPWRAVECVIHGADAQLTLKSTAPTPNASRHRHDTCMCPAGGHLHDISGGVKASRGRCGQQVTPRSQLPELVAPPAPNTTKTCQRTRVLETTGNVLRSKQGWGPRRARRWRRGR